MKRLAVLVLALTISVDVAAQGYREGTWWLNRTVAEQRAYASGMLDGAMRLAANILIVNITMGRLPADAANPDSPYGNVASRLVAGVTPTLLADGLNEFYRDVANRRIDAGTATFLILSRVHGLDQATFNQLVEGARLNPDPAK